MVPDRNDNLKADLEYGSVGTMVAPVANGDGFPQTHSPDRRTPGHCISTTVALSNLCRSDL